MSKVEGCPIVDMRDRVRPLASKQRGMDYNALNQQIRRWGSELGFQQVGVTDCDLAQHESWLNHWLEREFAGEMAYMSRHGTRRSRPDELVPGTIRVISARFDYEPEQAADSWDIMNNSEKGFISRYALGRDYHKVLRSRLAKLADQISEVADNHGFRAFTDSAPVLEKALAEKAGLGWIGKHTNLINSQAGSWFFLGEIYTNLPLPIDTPASNHCGSCSSCISACPTDAIVGPYQVDARRCISYLTIELRDAIPKNLRPLVGNRIYGCDDCQLVCPWNKFARPTVEPDFAIRHQLDAPDLIDLFGWSESEFLSRTEGMAIRRIGHECWLRNIAVAMGNAPPGDQVFIDALRQRREQVSDMVREHVDWALERQTSAASIKA